MARIGTRTATIAAAAGGLVTAFFALSPTAGADPAPAAPGAPGIDLMQQLGNAPAMASQFLQSAASMLAPKPAAIAAPATVPAAATPAAAPAPNASASLTLPQAPTSPVSAPMNSLVGTVPEGQLNLPASVPVGPLLSQLGLPGNLSSLPIPSLGANPVAPITAPAAPGQPAVPPNLNPFSALP